MRKPTLYEFFKEKNITTRQFMEMSKEEQQDIRTQFATSWGLPVEVMFGMGTLGMKADGDKTKSKEST